MWCVIDNRNYVCHVCAKGFLDSIFDYEVTTGCILPMDYNVLLP